MDGDIEREGVGPSRESDLPADQLARFAAEIESDPEVARALEEQRKIDRLKRLNPEVERGQRDYLELRDRMGNAPTSFEISMQTDGTSYLRRTVYSSEPSSYLTATASWAGSAAEFLEREQNSGPSPVDSLGPQHPLQEEERRAKRTDWTEVKERIDARVYGFGQAAFEDGRAGLALYAFDQSGYLNSGVVVGQVKDFLGRATAPQKAEYASTIRQIQSAKANPAPSPQGGPASQG